MQNHKAITEASYRSGINRYQNPDSWYAPTYWTHKITPQNPSN